MCDDWRNLLSESSSAIRDDVDVVPARTSNLLRPGVTVKKNLSHYLIPGKKKCSLNAKTVIFRKPWYFATKCQGKKGNDLLLELRGWSLRRKSFDRFQMRCVVLDLGLLIMSKLPVCHAFWISVDTLLIWLSYLGLNWTIDKVICCLHWYDFLTLVWIDHVICCLHWQTVTPWS